MSNMRDKQLKQVVCNHTTGVTEADMLGNILLFVERTNRPGPHGYHRKRTVRMSTKSKLRVAVKRTWRYSNELLRRILSIPGKALVMVRGCISSMRKKRLNR
jgi:hypothetical protein